MEVFYTKHYAPSMNLFQQKGFWHHKLADMEEQTKAKKRNFTHCEV